MVQFLVNPSFIAMGGSFGGENNFVTMILMMAIIFGIFYFLVIRPQQQQQSQHEKMVEELETGNNVITVGGIHGEISDVSEDVIQIDVEDGVTLKLTRDKVASVKDNQTEDSS